MAEKEDWTPQELAAVLRKWEHVGPRLCGRAADMIERQAALLQEFCACFGSFDHPLSRSLQGWDNPRLHRVRDKIMGGYQPSGDGPTGSPPNEGTSGRRAK